MKSLKEYITEVKERKASELTLKKMLVNFKCLGKFGKSVMTLNAKGREAAVDELIARGWLTDKLQVTPEGDKIVKANLDLCQESGQRFLAQCTVNVGPDELTEFNKLLKELELDEVISTAYGGGTIIVGVPEEAAADDDYAEAYLKELKERAPQWKFGKIEKKM